MGITSWGECLSSNNKAALFPMWYTCLSFKSYLHLVYNLYGRILEKECKCSVSIPIVWLEKMDISFWSAQLFLSAILLQWMCSRAGYHLAISHIYAKNWISGQWYQSLMVSIGINSNLWKCQFLRIIILFNLWDKWNVILRFLSSYISISDQHSV